jgi:TonB family protein
MIKHIVAFTFVLSASVAIAGAPPPSNPPLTHEEIKSTVDGHLGDVKACMRDHGSATGKLVVEFSISPDGKVNEPKPKERSSNAALDRCIASAFTKWTFPKPRGGVLMGVDYPFVFSAPKPPAQGKLDQAVIVKTVHDHQPDIKTCYDEAAKAKPGIAGTIKVAFVIAPSGKVSEAKVDNSTTEFGPLDQCVVGKLKSWTFPKPEGNGEVAIMYPFIFEDPTGGKAKQGDKDKQAKQH